MKTYNLSLRIRAEAGLKNFALGKTGQRLGGGVHIIGGLWGVLLLSL